LSNRWTARYRLDRRWRREVWHQRHELRGFWDDIDTYGLAGPSVLSGTTALRLLIKSLTPTVTPFSRPKKPGYVSVSPRCKRRSRRGRRTNWTALGEEYEATYKFNLRHSGRAGHVSFDRRFTFQHRALPSGNTKGVLNSLQRRLFASMFAVADLFASRKSKEPNLKALTKEEMKSRQQAILAQRAGQNNQGSQVRE